MNEKEAIQFLKDSLSKIPALAKLPYDNQEFKLWRNRVETIIKYGLDEDDYDTFGSVQPLDFLDDIGIENIEQSLDYPKKLKDYETALKSIIRKHETLRIEAEPPKVFEYYGAKIVDKELELTMHGTVDMTIECMMHFTKKLNSQGHSYKSNPRIGGHPDYAKPDRTCYATVTIAEIAEDKEKQIGTIQLQLIPEEKTLFKTSHPNEWDSSFKYFLDALFIEFEELGFMRKEKEALAEYLLPETITAKAGWKDIENKYDMTKNRFGRKINFVTDSFKRRILFLVFYSIQGNMGYSCLFSQLRLG